MLAVEVHETVDQVTDAIDKGSGEALARTAFAIHQDSVSSIQSAFGPAPPGQPPHTHSGRRLPRSIGYDADSDDAVIGPRASMIGPVGETNEKGLTLRGVHYQPRPFMGPALERNISVFGGNFEERIGG